MADLNHRTRWTVEEDEFLQDQWDGTHETAAVIAELLGRTTPAVAQRHYTLTWGTAAEPVQIRTELGDGRPATPSRRRVTIVVTDEYDACPDCFCEVTPSGACCC